MSFLVKRFKPLPEAPKPAAKQITQEERSAVLEARFVDVFRALKAEAPAAPETPEPPAAPAADWLRQLRSSAVTAAAAAQPPPVAAVAKKPFWRQNEETADWRERRAFVRSDAKQQRTAARRKLKGRRQV